MSNIIDKIQVSGVTYDLPSGGGGNATVELTQAEYDALVSAGTVSANTYYIITDAQEGDLSKYWTSAQTQSAITSAVSGKVDSSSVVSSVTSASTDSEIPTAKAVYDAVGQGGGGGKAISAGTNISVTTGETADTINCTVPASASSGNYSIMFGQPSSSGDASGTKTITGGQWSKAYGEGSVAIGQMNESRGSWAWAIGNGTSAVGQAAFACGEHNSTNNLAEFTCGYATITSGGSDTSLMTLFTVGNGKYQSGYQRHNALDIRMNGDIYISDTNSTSASNYWEKPMIKLQDALSMSGYVTTDTAQEITGEKTFVGEKKLKFKQSGDSSKIGFTLYNSASTNNELAVFEFRPNTYTVDSVQHPLMYFGHYRNTNTANAGVPQTVIGFRQYDQANSAAYHLFAPLPEEAKTPFSLTTSFQNYFIPLGFKNGSTMIKTDNTGVADFSDVLGGLKLVKLTQTEYDNLSTKDSNTLYVIVN